MSGFQFIPQLIQTDTVDKNEDPNVYVAWMDKMREGLNGYTEEAQHRGVATFPWRHRTGRGLRYGRRGRGDSQRSRKHRTLRRDGGESPQPRQIHFSDAHRSMSKRFLHRKVIPERASGLIQPRSTTWSPKAPDREALMSSAQACVLSDVPSHS